MLKRYLHNILTVTKIPSPTGKLSLVARIARIAFCQVSTNSLALKKNLHHDDQIQTHGNMLHLELESGVNDFKDSKYLYDIVSMTYFKWPQNGHCNIITMTACSSRYCKGELVVERAAFLVQQRKLHHLIPATMAMSCSSQREHSKSISETFVSPLDIEILL